MGLGKTLQVLAFLVSLLEKQQQEYGTGSGPHLVVMPLSVMTSWRSDILKYIPSGVMDVHVHLGQRDQREEGFSAWHQRLKEHRLRADRATDNTPRIFICLTSYNFAMNDIDLFRRLRKTKRSTLFWDYLIVDEAHRLKNSESKLFSCLLQLKSKHHLLLTGKHEQTCACLPACIMYTRT
jgi:SNF2 family DNA or RNA helicase